MTTRISVVVLSLVIVLSYQYVMSQSNSSDDGFNLVDKTGNIRRPSNYRDRYQALGIYAVIEPIPMVTGAVVKGAKNENDMHLVYATPGTAEYYRKNGKFADGTVLVKEVFGTNHAQMTTGDVHWASGTKQWFIMIKDVKGRYPNNPLWGNGWGWALFKSDAPDKQVAVNFKKDCLGCHIPAQATDWIYVQGYPVLAAK